MRVDERANVVAAGAPTSRRAAGHRLLLDAAAHPPRATDTRTQRTRCTSHIYRVTDSQTEHTRRSLRPVCCSERATSAHRLDLHARYRRKRGSRPETRRPPPAADQASVTPVVRQKVHSSVSFVPPCVASVSFHFWCGQSRASPPCKRVHLPGSLPVSGAPACSRQSTCRSSRTP